ncbi:ATP-binding protein [Victivallaceae bacterium BBE-744-WT-12]|uniref:ATP-binding protein n=1 Tax=Victivallis lenta TaxID=2606640 RepID=A0A844G3S3_9BACT|nr:ATP-binding protein [Victivallis lenta]MST97168.1 ATP-binding protein [Victivallis lenta]
MKNRPLYLKELQKYRDKSVIKVVTGIRRCGKSSLLQLFVEHLKEQKVPEGRILQINFESLQYDGMTYRELYNQVMEKAKAGTGKFYLFLDEIQRVEHWEKAINSFQVELDADIYITGSNAYLLSSDLATYLAGRYVEIRMLPLSFREFLDFHTFPELVSAETKFEHYLRFGGFPGLAEFDFNEKQIHEVLEGIYASAVLKDIYQRLEIRNSDLLDKVCRFFADNIGNTSSANRVAGVLEAEGNLPKAKKGISAGLVSGYVDALVNAFIFYRAGRYDIKGKELLKTLSKWYIVDMGFRNLLLGYRNADRGHILENLVYLELLRRGYTVSIGKIGSLEVDFIATNQTEKHYIQVTETMLGDETRARELEPLRKISDNYPKTVLTMDRSFLTNEDGIEIVNLIDWLLG